MNLGDLLTRQRIALNQTAADWRAAVRAAGNLLVQTGGVEPRYVDAMLRAAQELGPYIVLAPGLALPHARPEDGALQASLALVTLRPPVEFGAAENDPVRVVIALAAADAQEHIGALAQLMEALSTPGVMEGLAEAQSVEEALRWLAGG